MGAGSILTAAAAALLCAAAAASVRAAAAAAAAAAGPDPEVHVGDTWKYRSVDGFTQEPQAEFTQRVVDVNDREIVVEVRNSKNDKVSLRYFNRQWNLLDNGQTKYEPYYPEFKFPLSAGMNWSDKFTSFATDGGVFSGYVSGSVPVLEKITVTAGSFDAYRIERDIEFRSTSANALLTKWRIVTWYAPAVGRFVRREMAATRDGRVRAKSTEELIEYTPASKGATKTAPAAEPAPVASPAPAG